MSRAETRGLAVLTWPHARFVLGVLTVTVGSANAQTISAARESPLVSCCVSAPRSSMSTDTAIDTLPGLLRDAGFAPTSGDLAPAWRRYAVSATEVSGAWRLAQEARGMRRAQIEGQGGRNAGQWYLSGAASLRRDREDGVLWRNQSAASLTGLYVWADSVGGIWRGDEVALAASVATPRWHGVSLSLPAELGLGQSARRNDPRPLSRRRAMALSPALRWQHGRWEMGVAGTIGSIREDLEIGGGLSPEVPVVFRMRGIATFDRTQLNSADRTLLGQIVGARAAMAIRGARHTVVLGGAAYESTDDVRDGIATPENGGRGADALLPRGGAWYRSDLSCRECRSHRQPNRLGGSMVASCCWRCTPRDTSCLGVAGGAPWGARPAVGPRCRWRGIMAGHAHSRRVHVTASRDAWRASTRLCLRGRWTHVGDGVGDNHRSAVTHYPDLRHR